MLSLSTGKPPGKGAQGQQLKGRQAILSTPAWVGRAGGRGRVQAAGRGNPEQIAYCEKVFSGDQKSYPKDSLAFWRQETQRGEQGISTSH